MGEVCEHKFEQRDPANPDYSMVEYDLHARLGLTLRKNLKTGKYEIAKISSRQKVYEGTLSEMVGKANELEGGNNTKIGCGIWCPVVRARMKGAGR